ncbi:hypothetical protein [Halomonas colorata]|uniref:Uncharacterized protein n=1 Tax=Halomonas colorata TaxID=2742615 RepID=A0ABR9G2Q5_9GAMM|nr:hypothetical protein [Halomonas colorata]MBE0465210.1 hypothetical protein [Halomonas colorata]
MLKDRGSRRVPLSHIKVSHHLSAPVLRVFLARSSFLRDVQCMSEEAIKVYLLQHPPVVYENKRGKEGTPLVCIANLFPLYLAQRCLSGSEKIRVTLVEAPLSKNTETLALSLALSAETCHALSPKDLSHYIVSLWEHLASSDPQALINLSKKFNSKSSLCEALSINRRDV